MCILPVPFFEVYESGRFYGTSVPALPPVDPQTPKGKGWRLKKKKKKKKNFPYKVGA